MEAIARYPIVKNRTVKLFLIKNLSFLALLLALLTYGCAGPSKYRMDPGEDRPKTDIAIIDGSTAFLGITVCDVAILEVISQGQRIKLREPPGYGKVAVLPGFYTVSVEFGCVGSPGVGTELIAFNAQAGHEYEIKAHWWKLPPQLFVVDKNSGKEVSAETGDVIQFF